MGVYIKGMEMPEKCGKCRFATSFECQVTKNFITTFNVRQVDCPLVPIPPHGRLIDADALEVHDGWLRDSKYFSQDSGHTHITFVYSNAIMDAPTILEAEEE